MQTESTPQLLRKLRGKKSVKEVSKALGISEQSIYAYERGTRTPNDEKKKRIAKYYNRGIRFLFYR